MHYKTIIHAVKLTRKPGVMCSVSVFGTGNKITFGVGTSLTTESSECDIIINFYFESR